MNPLIVMLVGSVVRTIMAGGGTVVAAQGVQSGDDVQAFIGALTVVITFLWSAFQKYLAAKKMS